MILTNANVPILTIFVPFTNCIHTIYISELIELAGFNILLISGENHKHCRMPGLCLTNTSSSQLEKKNSQPQLFSWLLNNVHAFFSHSLLPLLCGRTPNRRFCRPSDLHIRNAKRGLLPEPTTSQLFRVLNISLWRCSHYQTSRQSDLSVLHKYYWTNT